MSLPRVAIVVSAGLFWIASAAAQSLTASSLNAVNPAGVVRGRTIVFTLSGNRVHDATAVFFDDDAISGRPLGDPKRPNQLRVETVVGPTARIGIHRVFVQASHGTTNAATFAVGDWPEVMRESGHNTSSSAQKITLPCTVVGALTSPGEADYFAFEGRAGQQVVAEVVASQIRSRLNSVLTLFDAEGTVIAENNDCDFRPDALLAVRLARDGRYVLRLHDFENQSGGDVSYRLNVGEFPLVTGVFPLGLQAGTTAEFTLTGFNLPTATLRFSAPSDTAGKIVTLPVESLRPARVAVSEFAEVRSSSTSTVPVPAFVNGRVRTSESERVRFRARRGEVVIIEVQARRLGSALDSVLEVRDAAGTMVPRATLRPVAETATTLNDRDSAATGLRLLSWTDFAINDFVYVGGEVIQVLQLPLGPDEDVRFRSMRGVRETFLDTTAVAHALNSPVYKVQIHPPGKQFPPNGMPLFTVPYRNDDGGPMFGKDSRLTFTAPADGEYTMRITDARGPAGERSGYVLTLRRPKPGFRLTMAPEHPNIPSGGSAVVTLTADRLDGFTGEIRARLEGLPAGWHATEGMIQAGETTGQLIIYAEPTAVTPTERLAFRVVGSALVNGATVTQTLEADRGVRRLTALPRPDLTVITDRSQLVIQPGRQVTMTALIERHNGFAGRVPVEVRNLPHGVRVLDVGLNGVLITEQQNRRQFVLYCEPWVQPMTWTFYVGGRVEGGVDSYAAPVQLIVKGDG